MKIPAYALLPLALFGLSGCHARPKPVKKPAVHRPAADPAKVQAHYIKGVYAYAEGDTLKAIAAWKEALALDPKHAPSLKAMAEAKEKLAAVKKMGK